MSAIFLFLLFLLLHSSMHIIIDITPPNNNFTKTETAKNQSSIETSQRNIAFVANETVKIITTPNPGPQNITIATENSTIQGSCGPKLRPPSKDIPAYTLLESPQVYSLQIVFAGDIKMTYAQYVQLYKPQWGGQMGSAEISSYRAMVFDENLKSINEHNRNTSKSYSKGVNQFADLTAQEFGLKYLKPLADFRAIPNPYSSLRSTTKTTKNISTLNNSTANLTTNSTIKNVTAVTANTTNANTSKNVSITIPSIMKTGNYTNNNTINTVNIPNNMNTTTDATTNTTTNTTNNKSMNTSGANWSNSNITYRFLLANDTANTTNLKVGMNNSVNSTTANISQLHYTEPDNWDIDWRCLGKFEVYEQLACSSGYAIAVLDALTVSLKIKGQTLPAFSIQEILSCARNEDNLRGCAGGFPDAVYKYIYLQGIGPASLYPTSLEALRGQQTPCDTDITYSNGYKKVRWFPKKTAQTLPHKDCRQVVEALRFQALSVMIQGYQLSQYTGGTFVPKDKSANLDHVVTLVGYSYAKGYLIKNSWGPKWGINGYAYVSKQTGICDYAMYIEII